MDKTDHNHPLILSILNKPTATATIPQGLLTPLLPWLAKHYHYPAQHDPPPAERDRQNRTVARALLMDLNQDILARERESGRSWDAVWLQYVAWIAVAKSCPRPTLVSIFTKPLNNNLRHTIPIASTLAHILVTTLLNLINIPSTTKTHVMMARYAAHTCRDLVLLLVHMVTEPSGESEKELAIVEQVAQVFFKSLSHAEKSLGPNVAASVSSTLQLSLYADLIHFLPATLSHTPAASSTIRFLSHPLLLIRHCVLPVIRTCIWSRDHASGSGGGARVLYDIERFLYAWSLSSTNKSTSTVNHKMDPFSAPTVSHLKLIVTQITQLLKILANAVVAAPRIKKMAARSGSPDKSKSKSMRPLIISDALAASLLKWSKTAHPTKAVHLFLIPILEQCLGVEENWQNGEKIVAGLFAAEAQTTTQGHHETAVHSYNAQSTSYVAATVQWMTRWLILTACWRREASSTLNQSKGSQFAASLFAPAAADVSNDIIKVGRLPDAEAETILRLFCIRLLGMAKNGNRQITLCLLSLFDDPSLRVRRTVAQAITYRCLNLLHQDLDPSAPQTLRHRRNNTTCTGHMHPDFDNPFTYIIQCAKDACSDSTTKLFAATAMTDSHWRGSERERDTFGLWAAETARHITGGCPLMMKGRVISQTLVRIEKLLKSTHAVQTLRQTLFRIFEEILSVLMPDVIVDHRGTANSGNSGTGAQSTLSDIIPSALKIMRALTTDPSPDLRLAGLSLCRKILHHPTCDPVLARSIVDIVVRGAGGRREHRAGSDDTDDTAHPQIKALRDEVLVYARLVADAKPPPVKRVAAASNDRIPPVTTTETGIMRAEKKARPVSSGPSMRTTRLHRSSSHVKHHQQQAIRQSPVRGRTTLTSRQQRVAASNMELSPASSPKSHNRNPTTSIIDGNAKHRFMTLVKNKSAGSTSPTRRPPLHTSRPASSSPRKRSVTTPASVNRVTRSDDSNNRRHDLESPSDEETRLINDFYARLKDQHDRPQVLLRGPAQHHTLKQKQHRVQPHDDNAPIAALKGLAAMGTDPDHTRLHHAFASFVNKSVPPPLPPVALAAAAAGKQLDFGAVDRVVEQEIRRVAKETKTTATPPRPRVPMVPPAPVSIPVAAAPPVEKTWEHQQPDDAMRLSEIADGEDDDDETRNIGFLQDEAAWDDPADAFLVPNTYAAPSTNNRQRAKMRFGEGAFDDEDRDANRDQEEPGPVSWLHGLRAHVPYNDQVVTHRESNIARASSGTPSRAFVAERVSGTAPRQQPTSATQVTVDSGGAGPPRQIAPVTTTTQTTTTTQAITGPTQQQQHSTSTLNNPTALDSVYDQLFVPSSRTPPHPPRSTRDVATDVHGLAADTRPQDRATSTTLLRPDDDDAHEPEPTPPVSPRRFLKEVRHAYSEVGERVKKGQGQQLESHTYSPPPPPLLLSPDPSAPPFIPYNDPLQSRGESRAVSPALEAIGTQPPPNNAAAAAPKDCDDHRGDLDPPTFVLSEHSTTTITHNNNRNSNKTFRSTMTTGTSAAQHQPSTPHTHAFLRPRFRRAVMQLLNTLFPPRAAGSRPTSESDDHDDHVTDDALESAPPRLHPLLKQVFVLDPALFVDLLHPLSPPPSTTTTTAATATATRTRITHIRHALQPCSRILTQLETDLGDPLSTAQAILVLRDQVTLNRLCCARAPTRARQHYSSHSPRRMREESELMKWVGG
ncbi:hypothetical protein DFJ77DRAFT_466816 [Powellomyces hirtus]|nr:hypothetical protein DFJ77DRAFT_466816 [Powellomyces hirtus]